MPLTQINDDDLQKSKMTGIKYIFGTSFDSTHKDILESDLHHEHYGPDSEHDLPDRSRGKTREQVLHEKRVGKLDLSKGPKPFGWFGTFFVRLCRVVTCHLITSDSYLCVVLIYHVCLSLYFWDFWLSI